MVKLTILVLVVLGLTAISVIWVEAKGPQKEEGVDGADTDALLEHRSNQYNLRRRHETQQNYLDRTQQKRNNPTRFQRFQQQQRQAGSTPPRRVNSRPRHARGPQSQSEPIGNFNVEVVPIPNVYLGEGPHWDAEKQELLYVDILRKGVLRYVPRTGQQFRLDLADKGEGWGDSAPLIVPVKGQPNKYVIGLGRSLRVLEWDGQSPRQRTSTRTLVVVNDGNPNGRFNDGKCDAAGRLWAGTMGYELGPGKIESKKGSLYKLGLRGRIDRHIGQVEVSNGLAWSPDNKVMYFADSFIYNIVAFDYDIRIGSIRRPRVVFDLKKFGIEGIADGMTIDKDGNLWIAIFGGYKVIHVDPRTGRLLNVIKLPTKNITSCTFGGPNLDILYITSAAHGLSMEQLAAEPTAGALFQVRNTGTRGVSGGIPYAGPI